MTKQEILEAVNNNKLVFWKSFAYQVHKGTNEYYITYLKNTIHENTVGLLDKKGNLIENPKDFFITTFK
tara:strand:- start:50 stop:256 length:207 start_codon:yes stop_codon:yes gene_type:complete